MRSVGRGSEETLDAVVRHHEALVRVEHHEAERHVVEGGVETVGEQGHVTRRDQRIEERAPQPRRDRFDAQEERQDDDDEDEPIGGPGHHQRERERNGSADDLRVHQRRAREIPSRDAREISERGGKAQKAKERIGRDDEGREAPGADQQHRRGRAGDVAQLPDPRDLDRPDALAPPVEPAHVEHAQIADHRHGDRAKKKPSLAGPDRGDDRRRRHPDRADEKGSFVLIEGTDQGNIDFLRQSLLSVESVRPKR